MPSHTFWDAFVSINSVDLSDHVKSVTLNYEANQNDDSAMGNDTEINLAGIKRWSISVNLKQDYDAGKVDATLFPLVGAAKFAVLVRPDKTAGVGTTNPNYSGNAVLASYPPVTGAHGDLHTTTAEFRSAGTLSRLTA